MDLSGCQPRFKSSLDLFNEMVHSKQEMSHRMVHEKLEIQQNCTKKWGKMKSITIHRLDDTVTRMIEARAKSAGQSLNKTVKALLEQSLGMRPPEDHRHADDFAEFLGVWENSDLKEFERCTAAIRSVEDKDWR
jgi:hypothetical protein